MRRRCPRCHAWVAVRKSGLMYAHRELSGIRAGQRVSAPCAGAGEFPWPWEDEAEEADFHRNGKWSQEEHTGRWFPAADNRRLINTWFICRRRLGETSLQFGPMYYKTAIALADHLNHAPAPEAEADEPDPRAETRWAPSYRS